MQAAKRKQDKELEALHERIDELSAENQKVNRSKKKVQEEVSEEVSSPCLGKAPTNAGSLQLHFSLF